jgi:hypothetical protein
MYVTGIEIVTFQQSDVLWDNGQVYAEVPQANIARVEIIDAHVALGSLSDVEQQRIETALADCPVFCLQRCHLSQFRLLSGLRLPAYLDSRLGVACPIV